MLTDFWIRSKDIKPFLFFRFSFFSSEFVNNSKNLLENYISFPYNDEDTSSKLEKEKQFFNIISFTRLMMCNYTIEHFLFARLKFWLNMSNHQNKQWASISIFHHRKFILFCIFHLVEIYAQLQSREKKKVTAKRKMHNLNIFLTSHQLHPILTISATKPNQTK